MAHLDKDARQELKISSAVSSNRKNISVAAFGQSPGRAPPSTQNVWPLMRVQLTSVLHLFALHCGIPLWKHFLPNKTEIILTLDPVFHRETFAFTASLSLACRWRKVLHGCVARFRSRTTSGKEPSPLRHTVALQTNTSALDWLQSSHHFSSHPNVTSHPQGVKCKRELR